MYRRFGFFGGNLRSDPPKPGGDFENPEGNPPGPRARRVARGIFKIPDGLRVSGEDSRTKKPNFVNIFFNTIYKSHKKPTPYFTSEISKR